MEGYINSAFSASQHGLARLWPRRAPMVDNEERTPPVTEPLDLDVDLDMDSFLSSLEKDSGRREDRRRDSGSFVNIRLDSPDGSAGLRSEMKDLDIILLQN